MPEPHHEQRAAFIALAAGRGWSHTIRRVFSVETVELCPARSRTKFTIEYHHQPDGSVTFLRAGRFTEAGRRAERFSDPEAAREGLAAMVQRFA